MHKFKEDNLLMRITLVILVLFFTSCSGHRENLDYPMNIKEISEVQLLRPDRESNGESAEIQNLSKEEIIQLMHTLKKAKAMGLAKFIPDYYIIFTTKTEGTKKFKINGNKIKGYDNDFSYEIEEIGFLINF